MYFLLTYARNDRREGGGMMALPKQASSSALPSGQYSELDDREGKSEWEVSRSGFQFPKR